MKVDRYICAEATASTCDQVAEATNLKDGYSLIWWQRTAPLLARVMATAGYGPSQQRQYLTFYAEQIIPFLGPYPHQFRSAITRSGLPLEFSVNYQQHWGNRPIVRIGLEPVTGNSGTEHDPYNQLPIVDLQGRLAQLELPGYDAALFDHFRSHHTVTVAEQDILKGRKVAGSDISASQMAYGFDLKDSTVSVKGYSFPALKCEVTGKDFGQVIRDSIKPLSSQMGSLPAFGMVDEYMLEAQAYSEFAFFSWDCVQPAKSRLKIYSSSNTVVWSRVEEIWTLGGRLRLPAVVQGLKYLRQLWDAIKLSDGNRAFTGGFDDGNDATPSPMVWNYEVRCNDPIPLTKFYFPVHGESDIAVVRGVAQFLEQIGLVEQGQKYIQTVQHLFPERDLLKTARLISWISFAYTETTGVYLSVYYHSTQDYPWPDEE